MVHCLRTVSLDRLLHEMTEQSLDERDVRLLTLVGEVTG